MALLSFAQAIRDASATLLASDPRVFMLGQGLWSPWYVGSSMEHLDRDFGRDRVIDSPVSENATTGAGVGAALAGARPVVIHPRMDFMVLALDPIINQAANWSYLFGGQRGVPITIRSIINRGGEQGAQHSQALQAMLMQVPGLKVVMPASPYHAKGLLIAAVNDGNPVIYIEDRWLYDTVGEVPAGSYACAIGKGHVRREGKDLTLVATSWMNELVERALPDLLGQGVDPEHIDLVSIKPWDVDLVLASVRKTGRLVVADSGWATCGVASEVVTTITERAWSHLKAPAVRVTLPDCPAPTSSVLEQAYYPGPEVIARAVRKVLRDPRELAAGFPL